MITKAVVAVLEMLVKGDLVHCPRLGALEILRDHLLGNSSTANPT
jgi:hypothetical protein